MKTRMTELFGIKHPIMLAGMNWLTTPKLVAAVSNAGGLGILGGSQYDAEGIVKAIKQIRDMTDKPFGVNLTFRVGPRQLIPIVIREKIPVLNYALGRPPDVAPVIKAVHEYGGKVIATVAYARHGQRAEELGADALSVTSNEAAAHAGNVGAVVLLPIVSSLVKIPCIGAGGFVDGRGLAAALALGAEGVAMGTRLACTKDAEVAEAIKQAWLKATEEDTIWDAAFDGIPSRVLKNKAAEEQMRKHMPMFDAFVGAMRMKKAMNLSYPELIRNARALKGQEAGFTGGERSMGSLIRFAVGSDLMHRATIHGDPVGGILPCGQGVGRVKDIPTVAEVIDRTVREAEAVFESMKAKFGAK